MVGGLSWQIGERVNGEGSLITVVIEPKPQGPVLGWESFIAHREVGTKPGRISSPS
jgi:hypothetical protein